MVSQAEVARIIWTQCLDVKPGEKALIITDKRTEPIAQSLLEAGEALCKCDLAMTSGATMNGQEPEKHIAQAMLSYDAILIPTTFSLTHTEASLRAAKAGARIITMPGITKDMFLRAIPVDYAKLRTSGESLIAKLRGREVTITSKAGTDLYLRTGGREYINCCGIAQKGKILNLPDGEVCVAPVERKSEGRVVVDVSSAPDSMTPFGIIGRVKKPFTITVDGGEVTDCTNPVLWKALTSAEHGTNLAELGVGTNPAAKITGCILEDEKVLGTCHIGFGTNKDLGGTVQTSIHMDCVLHKPIVKVDGRTAVAFP
jgi:leucyl aminopeptidase (aminopeptidase T)